MKSQADITLAEEVHRNWAEINTREYIFDRHQQEIKLLEACDKDEMIQFMTKLLSADAESSQRRKLSVQVVGSDVIDDETLEDSPDKIYTIKYHNEEAETFIQDIIEYKNSLMTYPIHKIIE